MEAANIAGKYVANAINNTSPKPTIRPRPLLFSPFRAIDSIAYNNNFPNIGPILFIIIVIYVIYIILKILRIIN